MPDRVKLNVLGTGGTRGGPPPSDKLGLSEFGRSLLRDSHEENVSYIKNLAFSVATDAIERSKGNIVCETPGELKHAVNIARQALGLDTESPAIQLSVFGAQNDVFGPAIASNYGADVVDVVETTAQPDWF